MAKLILVCATLALFVLLANASIYRTIVEFDEDDDVSNQMRPQGDKCQRQFMQQHQLRGCTEWIRQRAQQGRRPGYEADDFELTLDIDLEDDENRRPQYHRPDIRRCCNELRQVDRMCVCPTLRQAAQQVRLQGMRGPQQVQHILQTAQNLPNLCNIPAVGSCPFQAVPY